MNFLKKVFFVIILVAILAGMSNISRAEQIQAQISEKSESYKQWEQLSDKERKNSIEPTYYSIDFKESVKKSTYNKLMGNVLGDSLESSYRRPAITVKNQNNTNICWAFAFSSMLEGTGKGRIYSPAFMDYKATSLYNKKQGTGATLGMALAVSTSGNSPILENNFKFEDVYNTTNYTADTSYLKPITQFSANELNKNVEARIIDSKGFPNINKSIDSNKKITYSNGKGNNYTEDKNNNSIPDEVESIRETIKQHIKNKGPVESSIYMDTLLRFNGSIIGSSKGYYNAQTQAYFCNNASNVANHAITIVGWDDNYAVSNFTEGMRPTNPGAYIILNSYGNIFGNDAYLYVSYEDVHIEETAIGIEKLEEYEDSEDIPYENIYQHDELGANLYMDCSKNIPSALVADVYTRDNSKEEYITEIGVTLLSTEGIQIYINPDGEDKAKLKLVDTELQNITPGYHIIKLAHPVKLTSDKFTVGVKYTNSEVGANIPLEANYTDCGYGDFGSATSIYDTAKANLGESFISIDSGKNWKDLSDNYKIGSNTLKNTSTCIKAYTVSKTNEEPWNFVTGLSIDKTNLTLKVGKTEYLKATINPTNATNKNIKWISSNTKVATVSEEGLVTAVSEGTATITAITEEGEYEAVSTINVKANESQNTKVSGITLNNSKLNIEKGKNSTLVAIITPTNATNKNVKWTSSNTKVATVSQLGIVTAVEKGTAIITATSEDGGYTAKCTVTVDSVDEDKIYKSDSNIQKTKNQANTTKSKRSTGETGNIQTITVGKSTSRASSAQSTDDSKTPSRLPDTGNKIVILCIIGILGISAVVMYVRYKNL